MLGLFVFSSLLRYAIAESTSIHFRDKKQLSLVLLPKASAAEMEQDSVFAWTMGMSILRSKGIAAVHGNIPKKASNYLSQVPVTV